MFFSRIRFAVALALVSFGLIPASPGFDGRSALFPELAGDEWPFATNSPLIACTPIEVQRLKEAFASVGPEHEPVARVIAVADEALSSELVFPPEGGQHENWYQCRDCQVRLQPVGDGGHRCPECGRIYSGQPYDGVAYLKVHKKNLRAAYSCAWAYAITSRRPYAEYAVKVLLGYADRYEHYPYHDNLKRSGEEAGLHGGRLFSQTLDEGLTLATRIAPAYDLIHDSGILTREDHDRIRKHLLIPILQNVEKYRKGRSNWQTYHNAAMFIGGAVLRDVSWMRRAITDPSNGFEYQMNHMVTEDGMWREGSWGYHFAVINIISDMATAAERLGVDLWSNATLHRMCVLPVYYAMPNGTIPRFGDTSELRLKDVGKRLVPAYDAIGDTRMLRLMSEQPTWDSIMLGCDLKERAALPPLESRVFEGAGHAILRSHGRAGLTAASTFGPDGGFHGHLDKLSFVFFGFGEELGVDPGRAPYNLPVHKHWYKPTLSHNAVVVDKQRQQPAEGVLEYFGQGEACSVVVMRCDDAYPQVEHRRVLLLMPTYLLVSDALSADRERRFDWWYHNLSERAVCDAVGKTAEPENDYEGYEYIKNAKEGLTGDTLRVDFAGGNVLTRVTMAGNPGTRVRTATGPGRSVREQVPLTMVSRHGKHVQFAAVIEPVLTGMTQAVLDVSCSRKDGGTVIRVHRRNGEDIVVLKGAEVRLLQDGRSTSFPSTLDRRPCNSLSH